jgi:hypothetical protein
MHKALRSSGAPPTARIEPAVTRLLGNADDAAILHLENAVGDIDAQGVRWRGQPLRLGLRDHGGVGGGYENTWGTDKLYFEATKLKSTGLLACSLQLSLPVCQC